MVTVKIREEDLLDLLMNRLADWTTDETTTELYEKMYENYVYGGVYDGMELDIMVIVDNDYINYCTVIRKDDDYYDAILEVYRSQGLGDCSCEDCEGNFIEAVTDDEEAFLIRW